MGGGWDVDHEGRGEMEGRNGGQGLEEDQGDESVVLCDNQKSQIVQFTQFSLRQY